MAQMATNLSSTAFELILSELQRIQYQELAWRTVVPEGSINMSGEGRYKTGIDLPVIVTTGATQLMRTPGDNIPTHSLGLEKIQIPFYEFKNAGFIDEMSAAAWSESYAISVAEEIANSMKSSMEKEINDMVLFGKIGISNIQGLLHYPHVPAHEGHVLGLTEEDQGREIADIIAYYLTEMLISTKKIHKGTVVYVSPKVFTLLQKPRYLSNTVGLGTGSSMQYLLENNITYSTFGIQLKIVPLLELESSESLDSYGRIMIMDHSSSDYYKLFMPVSYELRETALDIIKGGYTMVAYTKCSPIYVKSAGAIMYVDLKKGL